MNKYISNDDINNIAIPYGLGYWHGRSTGYFENGTYENMTEKQQQLFKIGYDAGVSDYCEMDIDESAKL